MLSPYEARGTGLATAMLAVSASVIAAKRRVVFIRVFSRDLFIELDTPDEDFILSGYGSQDFNGTTSASVPGLGLGADRLVAKNVDVEADSKVRVGEAGFRPDDTISLRGEMSVKHKAAIHFGSSTAELIP